MDNPRTYWDTFNSSYQMGSQKHRTYLLDKLKEFDAHSLLDVGCGTGPIFEMLIDAPEGQWDNITKYKGTDYAQGMIEVCQSLFPKACWQVEDARHLDEPDQSWDCVLLMHCLDHLDNYQAAIREAARVSKKYILIVLWRPFVTKGTNLNSINRMDKKEGEEPWEDTHLQDYSEEVLLDEFAKNNLFIRHEACKEEINDPNRYNYMWLLEKLEEDD